MIKSIRKYGDPILRAVCDPFTGTDEELVVLVRDLVDTLNATGGQGLAAPQIGVPSQVFILTLYPVAQESALKISGKNVERSPNADPKIRAACRGDYAVMINPEILEVGDIFQTSYDGCLSIPKLHGKTERASSITLRSKDGIVLSAWGKAAHAMQHELDHLVGILWIDHLTKEDVSVMKNDLERIANNTNKRLRKGASKS